MNEVKHSPTRSAPAFVFGLLFIAASLVVWSQIDGINGDEAITGVWLGLGCLGWGLAWVVVGVSSAVDRLVVQAMAFVATTMGVMVAVDYLTWERAGLYLLEALAVVAVVVGITSRNGRTDGRPAAAAPTQDSGPAFIAGVVFAVASLVTWYLTDIAQSEVFWGIWLGLGCLGWGLIWLLLGNSSETDRVVSQALGLVVVVMASMAAVGYLVWDQVVLYLFEALTVIAAGFGVVYWLGRPSGNPEPAAEPVATAG